MTSSAFIMVLSSIGGAGEDSRDPVMGRERGRKMGETLYEPARGATGTGCMGIFVFERRVSNMNQVS